MKNPSKTWLRYTLILLLLPSCKKALQSAHVVVANHSETAEFVKYTIRQGEHYADRNPFQFVHYDELKFVVKFDSSAIYQNVKAINQEDINKLYGFSDNNAPHQEFSARFGWNWTRGALRLYSYVYNNGERISHEIAPIEIGSEYTCSIKISSARYIFSVNNVEIETPRNSTTEKGSGYKLFPYFGGDEPAPHDINIWIKEL